MRVKVGQQQQDFLHLLLGNLPILLPAYHFRLILQKGMLSNTNAPSDRNESISTPRTMFWNDLDNHRLLFPYYLYFHDSSKAAVGSTRFVLFLEGRSKD